MGVFCSPRAAGIETPRAGFAVTHQGAMLADRETRIGGILG
jgi:hypothetical protein